MPSAKFKLLAPTRHEHELQIDCTRMLRIVLLPDVAWTAIDHAHSLNMQVGRNGRPIGLIEAAKRRERGVRAGIPDYLLWRQGQGFAVEMKEGDGGLSDSQKDFFPELMNAGVKLKVCWTLDQVFLTVKNWNLCRPAVMW